MKTRNGRFDNETQPERIWPREIHKKDLPNVDNKIYLPNYNPVKRYNEINNLNARNNYDRTRDVSKHAFVVDWQMNG